MEQIPKALKPKAIQNPCWGLVRLPSTYIPDFSSRLLLLFFPTGIYLLTLLPKPTFHCMPLVSSSTAPSKGKENATPDARDILSMYGITIIIKTLLRKPFDGRDRDRGGEDKLGENKVECIVSLPNVREALEGQCCPVCMCRSGEGMGTWPHLSEKEKNDIQKLEKEKYTLTSEEHCYFT